MGEARVTEFNYVNTGGIVLQLRWQHGENSNCRLGGPCIDDGPTFIEAYLRIKAGHCAGLFRVGAVSGSS
jgi:hypothetical protein